MSGEHVLGDLTISGDLQAGLSFGIKDIDDHWKRDLRFHDDMNPAPTLSATVALDYAMTQLLRSICPVRSSRCLTAAGKRKTRTPRAHAPPGRMRPGQTFSRRRSPSG
nr:hypothetical protein [Rhizobium indigoferae]